MANTVYCETCGRYISSEFTPNDLVVFGICNVGLGFMVFVGVLLQTR